MNKELLAKMMSGQVDQSVIQGIKKMEQTLNESYDVPSADSGDPRLDSIRPLSKTPPTPKKEKVQFKPKVDSPTDDELEDELRFQKIQEKQLRYQERLQANMPKPVDSDEIFALINGKKTKDIIAERKEKEQKQLLESSKNTTVNKLVEKYEDPSDLLKRQPKPQEKTVSSEDVKDIFNEEFIYNKRLEKIVKSILKDDDMKSWLKSEIKTILKEIITESKK